MIDIEGAGATQLLQSTGRPVFDFYKGQTLTDRAETWSACSSDLNAHLRNFADFLRHHRGP